MSIDEIESEAAALVATSVADATVHLVNWRGAGEEERANIFAPIVRRAIELAEVQSGQKTRLKKLRAWLKRYAPPLAENAPESGAAAAGEAEPTPNDPAQKKCLHGAAASECPGQGDPELVEVVHANYRNKKLLLARRDNAEEVVVWVGDATKFRARDCLGEPMRFRAEFNTKWNQWRIMDDQPLPRKEGRW